MKVKHYTNKRIECDPQDREIAQETKLLISEIGDDLVESGLLAQLEP